MNTRRYENQTTAPTEAGGRCQIRVYSVRKDMDGTVVGIRYGYNSDEYAHLWHFAMTSDELKSEAMKIYILQVMGEIAPIAVH